MPCNDDGGLLRHAKNGAQSMARAGRNLLSRFFQTSC